MRYRQTWGVVLAKAILDPYWFLVADWFALFLVSRGFKLEDTLVGFWVPFVCADIGNFVGGGLSSYFIHRGEHRVHDDLRRDHVPSPAPRQQRDRRVARERDGQTST